MESIFPTKVKRNRFTNDDDIVLLKEVLGYNPYCDHSRWTNIQESLEKSIGKKFNIRTIKEHVDLLAKQHVRKEEENTVKSGTEEAVTEKDFLLQEVCLLIREYAKREKNKMTPKISFEKAKAERDMWANELNSTILNQEFGTENSNNTPDSEVNNNNGSIHDVILEEEVSSLPVKEREFDTCSGRDNQEPVQADTSKLQTSKRVPVKKVLVPSRQRIKRQNARLNAINYLDRRAEIEDELKKREFEIEEKKIKLEQQRLELEERKVRLEEQKLELKKEEHLQTLQQQAEKFRMEMEERRQLFGILKSQKDLIQIILNNSD